MKHKYFGPYDNNWMRNAIDITETHCMIGINAFGVFMNGGYWCYDHCGSKTFKTPGEAMKALDAYLVSEGCVFLTQEQVDKLKILL